MQFHAHKPSLSGPMYNVTESAENGKKFWQFYIQYNTIQKVYFVMEATGP